LIPLRPRGSREQKIHSAGPSGKRRALEIFLVFARISLSSFGGANFWMRRVLIEDKRWLTDAAYLETLALGQVLPGPNVYNVTVMLGHRFGGYAGVAAAVGGLLAPALAAVSLLGLAYRHFGALAGVQRALGGMTAVAAGLVIANGIALARTLPRALRPWLFLALAFAGVGALRLPLIAVMGTLAPVAVALAWREAARGAGGGA
jgi:chromate transporter